MSTDKRSIVRNRDNGGAPSDTRFGEVTKGQSSIGATDNFEAAREGFDDFCYDNVVPTGEAVVGRNDVVFHITSGAARYGERVNLDRGSNNKVSGDLTKNADGSTVVIDDDGKHWHVLSYDYNNLTPNNLIGFRYQRSKDEAAEEDDTDDAEEGNPAYPNGRCRACGFGLNDNGDCTNYDCSRSVENDDDAFEEAHAAYLDDLSGVNRRDDDCHDY